MVHSLRFVLVGLLLSLLPIEGRAAVADIRANGSDGPVRVAEGQEIRLSVRLVPDGALRTRASDWWLVGVAGGVAFFYHPEKGWGPTPQPVLQAPGLALPFTEVVVLPPLPPGKYIFYFGIDDDDDGLPTPVAYDSVEVEVATGKNLPPRGGALIQAAAVGGGRARFTWLPADDDTTPASALVYELHLGEDEAFTPGAATLRARVTGRTEAEVESLPVGKKLYARVIARDADGLDGGESSVLPFTLPAGDAVLSAGVSLVAADSLGLTGGVLSGGNLVVAKTADTRVPTVGSVLSGSDAGGTPYLLRVDSVAEAAGSLSIATTPLAVSQVYGQGALSTVLRLDDLATAGGGQFADETRRVRTGNVALSSGGPGSARFAEITGSVGVSLETQLVFNPRMSYDFSWHGGSLLINPVIDNAEIVMIGEFHAETSFGFQFEGAATYAREFDITIPRLFPRTFQTRMFVGNVPVLIDVTLSLKGKVSASASAAIDTQGVAAYRRTITLGLRYDPQTGQWQTIPSTEFERTLTVALNARGGVSGELRLIPNIEAKFNKILSVGASVEPFLLAEASVEAVAERDLLGGTSVALTQPKVFDVSLNAECYGYVDLNVLIKNIPLLSGKVCGPFSYPLFTLPSLALDAPQGTAASLGKPLPLVFSAEDGTNDPFSLRSAKYEVHPLGKKVSVKAIGTTSPEKGKTVTSLEFLPCEAGSYVVYASGYGKLGEVGRQYRVQKIEVAGSGTCELTAQFRIAPADTGPAPLAVMVDASESSDPDNQIVSYTWSTADGQSASGKVANLLFQAEGIHAVTLTVANRAGKTATKTDYVSVASCLYGGPITRFTPRVSFAVPFDRIYKMTCIATTPERHSEQVVSYRPDGVAYNLFQSVYQTREGVTVGAYQHDVEWGEAVPGDRSRTSLFIKEASVDLPPEVFKAINNPWAALAASRGNIDTGIGMRYEVWIGADWQLESLQTYHAAVPSSFYYSCNRNGDGKNFTAIDSGSAQPDSQCRAVAAIPPIARPPAADKSRWRGWQ